MAIRILVTDDHEVVRKGICALLDEQPDMEVVGEAGDGRAAVRLAQELHPDLVLMDVGMPGLNGIVATQRIVSQRPSIRVLGLSMHSNKEFVCQMLRAGAQGYVLKSCALEELVNAVRAAVAGETYLSPKVAGSVVDDYIRRLESDAGPAAPVLCDKECEVLQLVAEGKLTKEIAAVLHVRVRTIEGYRHRIMDKLGVHSVAELTKYAIREGLTPLDG